MRLDLDLSTHEFLTDPDVSDEREIKAGAHLIRLGDPDPKSLNHGAHPDGEPVRIARDSISGKYFARVFEHRPSAGETARDERQLHRFAELNPIHVNGQGFWVPLEKLCPDHPHVEMFNGVAEIDPEVKRRRLQKAIDAAKARLATAAAAAQQADEALKQLESQAAI